MKLTTRQITTAGLLGAITIVLGITRLGFVGPFPPLLLIAVTIMQIPAIIGGVLEGPVVGVLIGLLFGLSSFFQAPTETPPTNLWFANPLVSILPRMFIGLTAAYAYRGLRKINEWVALIASALVGTLTNTVLVIGMVIILGYSPAATIIPAILPNVSSELIVSAIIVTAVVGAWKGLSRGKTGSSV